MKRLLIISGLLIAGAASAQIELDRPVMLTGPGPERVIEGLADPQIESSVVRVEVLSSAMVHWGEATWNADTLVLAVAPDLGAYRDGLLMRFLPPSGNAGGTWLKVIGHPAYRVIRHDGLGSVLGDLLPNKAAEVVHVNGSWVLLNASHEHCPPGALPVNARTCIDVSAVPGLRFYEAVDRCADRGGKLCAWDEYAAACLIMGTQLIGLFDEWEWIDDSSNHTHTSNQAGRFTCQSQRSINVITVFTGDTRCCYHPR